MVRRGYAGPGAMPPFKFARFSDSEDTYISLWQCTAVKYISFQSFKIRSVPQDSRELTQLASKDERAEMCLYIPTRHSGNMS